MPDPDKVENADQSDQAADSGTKSSTLETIEAKMAALQGDVEGNGNDDDDNSQIVDDDKSVSSDDSSDSENDDVKNEDDNSPMLPAGHRRAALNQGWTNEEIDHFIETRPDEATAEFKEVFNAWQDQNAVWSKRGRQLVEAELNTSDKGEDGDDKEGIKVLPHYDASALVKEHGGENEDFINSLIAPLNTMIDRVNDVTSKLSDSEKFLQDTEGEALTVATQDFFKSKDMEPFKDTYGVGLHNEVTEEQFKSRMELLEQADIIVAGAKDHGVDITVQGALERAHIIVSQGTRDEAMRQSIRDSMKKRTITTKSSHKQTSTTDTDQPISDEELEKRTEDRLRTLREKR